MLTCTLDLYSDYLLSSTGPTTATGLSRRLDGALSHDHITRWLSQTTYGPTDIWRQAKALIRQAEAQRPASELAVLIVVDSVLEKAHTDANELICTHWDHSQQRYVKGLKFVSLRYQANELAPPIAVELMRKTVPVYQPKTQKRVISARSPRMSTCSRYCAWRSHRWPTATCWPTAGTPQPRIRPWCGPWATPFFLPSKAATPWP